MLISLQLRPDDTHTPETQCVNQLQLLDYFTLITRSTDRQSNEQVKKSLPLSSFNKTSIKKRAQFTFQIERVNVKRVN